MININEKKFLESAFAEDFSSPFYPILADLYLAEGDMNRARKVCEVGLQHDSTNVDGKFILSKIAVAEEKFLIAEKLLKLVVIENPSHFNALRLLIKVEFQLNRSFNTIERYINKILKFLPNDSKCLEWLDKALPKEQPPAIEKTISPVADSSKTKSQSPKQDKGKGFEIIESMATFSMVDVFKSQHHYQHALSVLDKLEINGKDKDRIAKIRQEIMKLISDFQK